MARKMKGGRTPVMEWSVLAGKFVEVFKRGDLQQRSITKRINPLGSGRSSFDNYADAGLAVIRPITIATRRRTAPVWTVYGQDCYPRNLLPLGIT